MSELKWDHTQTNAGTSTKTFTNSSPVMSLQTEVVSGSPTYTVSYTVNGNDWVDVTDMTSATASAFATLAGPVYQVRTVVTGTGVVTLTGLRASYKLG